MLHKICCDLHGWLTYAFFSDRSRSRCPCFTQLRKRSLWTLQARLRGAWTVAVQERGNMRRLRLRKHALGTRSCSRSFSRGPRPRVVTLQRSRVTLAPGPQYLPRYPRRRARSRLLQWQNSSKSYWIESPSAKGRREESTKPTRSSGSPSSDLSLRFARRHHRRPKRRRFTESVSRFWRTLRLVGQGGPS